jgi:hypothetical protein
MPPNLPNPVASNDDPKTTREAGASISGKSPLAAAIRYALTRMARLRPYLGHGILELDNSETLFAIDSRTTDVRHGEATAHVQDRKSFAEQPKVNVGFVIYTLGDQPGTMNAVWGHQINGGGTVKAVGGEGAGYIGAYHITYYNWEGCKRVENTLEITSETDDCDLTWYKDGAIATRGIGRETPDGLIAGIRFLPD